MKLVKAIRRGWIRPKVQVLDSSKGAYYQLWDDADAPQQTGIQAPKQKLPGKRTWMMCLACPHAPPICAGHRESYRPLPEYLPTETTVRVFNEQKAAGETKRAKWIPTNYDALRHLPGYAYALQERFSRCLDLYMCPRTRRIKLNINPDDLLPKLPDLKDLRPFPTTLSSTWRGHESPVTCMSMDPAGHWLLSGDTAGVVKLWEVFSTRTLQSWTFDGPIVSVAWNPNKDVSLFSVVVGDLVTLITPRVAAPGVIKSTQSMLKTMLSSIDKTTPAATLAATWSSLACMTDLQPSMWVTIQLHKVSAHVGTRKLPPYILACVPVLVDQTSCLAQKGRLFCDHLPNRT